VLRADVEGGARLQCNSIARVSGKAELNFKVLSELGPYVVKCSRRTENFAIVLRDETLVTNQTGRLR
jgi:hypothetical protein